MTMHNQHEPPAVNYRLKLALAWGFVGIPLVWGVVQTLLNAIKAFY
jgi:hypothetical protein